MNLAMQQHLSYQARSLRSTPGVCVLYSIETSTAFAMLQSITVLIR